MKSSAGKALFYLIKKMGYKLTNDLKDLTKTQISFMMLADQDVYNEINKPKGINPSEMTKEEFANAMGIKIVKRENVNKD